MKKILGAGIMALILALAACSNYNLSLKDFFGDHDRDLEDFGPVPAGSIRRFEVANEGDWNYALGAIGSGGNYVITLTDSFDIPDSSSTFGSVTGIKVSLRGAKTLSVNSLYTGMLLELDSGQTLILREATLKGHSGNTLSMVHLTGGSEFLMRSGTISDNTAGSAGAGGVYVGSGGVFTMSGGTISDNTATGGGGVFVDSGGSFDMSGSAVISDNTVNGSTGGGVYVSGSGSGFTMRGGTISGNTATYGGGGGVSVSGGGAFIMSGGTIFNNTAGSGFSGGGGVSVSGTGSFTMSGGTISGNTAVSGGGVWVNSGSTFNKSGGGIIYGDDNNTPYPGDGNPTDNTATSGNTNGHAVYYVAGPDHYRDNTLTAVHNITTINTSDPLWDD
jgi:parallel beta-helix repeat protein